MTKTTQRKTVEVARKRVPLRKLLHGKEIRAAAKALEDFRMNLNEAEFLYGAKITLTMDTFGECVAVARRPETDKEFADRMEKARLAAEAKKARNLAKYGYKDWYDFCVGEWGTKWDVGEQGASDIHPGGRMLHTVFDSAWSPPINAYEKLVELGFGVEAQYYEGGMAFAGTWTNGSDEYVDLGGMSADDIEQNYADLDECFGISESMREFAEPEEELTAWVREAGEKLGLTAK